jgi:hypothetical protein
MDPALKEKVLNKHLNSKLDKMEKKGASIRARENLEILNKPRKAPPKMFIAMFTSGECPTCFLGIEAGQKVHYNSDGFIVHHTHKHVEPEYTVCPKCFLTLPCECDA